MKSQQSNKVKTVNKSISGMNRGMPHAHKDFKHVPFARVFSKVLLANRRLICKATSSYQNRHKKVACIEVYIEFIWNDLNCIYLVI